MGHFPLRSEDALQVYTLFRWIDLLKNPEQPGGQMNYERPAKNETDCAKHKLADVLSLGTPGSGLSVSDYVWVNCLEHYIGNVVNSGL